MSATGGRIHELPDHGEVEVQVYCLCGARLKLTYPARPQAAAMVFFKEVEVFEAFHTKRPAPHGPATARQASNARRRAERARRTASRLAEASQGGTRDVAQW